jgi:hypothetical protein
MEPIEIQVTRHNEQIKAIVDQFDKGITRLEAALLKHADDDATAHAKTDALAVAVDVQAKVSRRLWGIVTAAAVAGNGIATAAVHFWPK